MGRDESIGVRNDRVEWIGAQTIGEGCSGVECREGMGVEWNRLEWSRVDWSGVEWSGAEWSGAEWSGVEWSGAE